jgi:hypothetical protein
MIGRRFEGGFRIRPGGSARPATARLRRASWEAHSDTIPVVSNRPSVVAHTGPDAARLWPCQFNRHLLFVLMYLYPGSIVQFLASLDSPGVAIHRFCPTAGAACRVRSV